MLKFCYLLDTSAMFS